MRKRRASLLAAIMLVLAAIMPGHVFAQQIRLIRDAEIESIIRLYSTPLFQAAGLSPRDIDVYLVNDPRLNAFVAGGLNMFIHTGTLMQADGPLEVIGVIAHETGHIAAGHGATRGENLRKSTKSIIASYILGLGAALATGRGELAQAVISGGQDIALKGLLSYSRAQESSADQIAIRLLNGTGQSPSGLLSFMRKVSGQEVLYSSNQDPYLRSHPLTRERIQFLEDQVHKSRYGRIPASPKLIALHKRMQAKLIGFLQPMDRVLRLYPETDTSLPAQYARAISNYRNGDMRKGIKLTDALLAEHPDDPYFHELKAQILFESGQVAEAIPEYEKAAQLQPDSPQLAMALAQAQIEMNDPPTDQKALMHLARALRHEPNNSFAWRLTAIAHGRTGDIGMTALALAESALARGRAPEARDQAARAKKILAEGSPSWLRAGDIEQLASQLADKKK
ncbi:MAG: M48 family metalloprotease [Alphaproteobacteria bacterium]